MVDDEKWKLPDEKTISWLQISEGDGVKLVKGAVKYLDFVKIGWKVRRDYIEGKIRLDPEAAAAYVSFNEEVLPAMGLESGSEMVAKVLIRLRRAFVGLLPDEAKGSESNKVKEIVSREDIKMTRDFMEAFRKSCEDSCPF